MAELSVFILKSQSLHLYRSFLRTLKEAPKHVQGPFPHMHCTTLRDSARCDYEYHSLPQANCTNKSERDLSAPAASETLML